MGSLAKVSFAESVKKEAKEEAVVAELRGQLQQSINPWVESSKLEELEKTVNRLVESAAAKMKADADEEDMIRTRAEEAQQQLMERRMEQALREAEERAFVEAEELRITAEIQAQLPWQRLLLRCMAAHEYRERMRTRRLVLGALAHWRLVCGGMMRLRNAGTIQLVWCFERMMEVRATTTAEAWRAWRAYIWIERAAIMQAEREKEAQQAIEAVLAEKQAEKQAMEVVAEAEKEALRQQLEELEQAKKEVEVQAEVQLQQAEEQAVVKHEQAAERHEQAVLQTKEAEKRAAEQLKELAEQAKIDLEAEAGRIKEEHARARLEAEERARKIQEEAEEQKRALKAEAEVHHTLLSCTPLIPSSHTLLSCTPLMHSSHALLSCTPLFSYTLLSSLSLLLSPLEALAEW
jgi:hypothetical protein